jgi:GNAT superfamily N-acetyltransferase
MKVQEYGGQDMSEFVLWWDDLEEAGVESVLIACVDGEPVAFQAINIDGKTVAIEVLDTHQGQGISLALIEESGSYKPERNENQTFWDRIEEIMEAA